MRTLALVILLILSQHARCETLVEAGLSQVGKDFSDGWVLTLTERFKDRYDLTIGLVTTQTWESCPRPDCVWEIQEQIFFGGEFTYPIWRGLRFGIGPYWFSNINRVSAENFRMGLRLEYRFTDRFGIRARHWSISGSGRDATVCHEWGEQKQIDCFTNRWNAGQDSWLGVVLYF